MFFGHASSDFQDDPAMGKGGRSTLEPHPTPTSPPDATDEGALTNGGGEAIAAWNELFHRAKGGSSSAIGNLLDQCRGYLTVIVQQEINQQMRAKIAPSDLVQESLLEAYRGFENFQGTSERELLGWLRKTLLNNCADAVRHYRGTARRAMDRECSLDDCSDSDYPRAVVESQSSLPLDKAIRNEQQQRALDGIRQLPERQRRAVMLRNLEAKSFSEIGEALQISTDAARKLWERAIQRLAENLDSNDRSSIIT